MCEFGTLISPVGFLRMVLTSFLPINLREQAPRRQLLPSACGEEQVVQSVYQLCVPSTERLTSK